MTTETTAPVPEPDAPRRLTRSSSDRVIAGVCGGLGRYLGIDPVVCRLLFVVLIFFGGAGLIGYGAAWLIVPRDDAPEGARSGRALARRALMVIGVIALTGIVAFAGLWTTARGGATATAVVVVIAGVALVLGGMRGGMRWLIAPALALAFSSGFVAAANVDARGAVGERIYRPLNTAELRSNYRLGVGHLVLDLRQAHLSPGDHRVKLRLGIGGAEVLVPPSVCVSSDAHFGIGGTEVFQRDDGGLDVDFQDNHSAGPETPRVIVDADVGIGGLRIQPAEHGRFAGNEACSGG